MRLPDFEVWIGDDLLLLRFCMRRSGDGYPPCCHIRPATNLLCHECHEERSAIRRPVKEKRRNGRLLRAQRRHCLFLTGFGRPHHDLAFVPVLPTSNVRETDSIWRPVRTVPRVVVEEQGGFTTIGQRLYP